MPFYFFQWTEERVAHLQLNDVSQDEFEYVVCRSNYRSRSRSTGNKLTAGFTAEGRYIVCIYREIDKDTLMPITAYEPD